MFGFIRAKLFASSDAAQKWFNENDPEGVAFMYPVEGAEEIEAMPGIAPELSGWATSRPLCGMPRIDRSEPIYFALRPIWRSCSALALDT
jgi:hypothetical protein